MHMISRVLALVAIMSGGSAAAPVPEQGTSVVTPIEELRFYQNKEGMTVANGWGDPATGPHSNYIKMPGGGKSGPHTHSFSYYGIVVAGVIANEPNDAATVHPMRVGSYWYQKGGQPHVTNCISTTECLIFVTSKGPFDFLPLQEPGQAPLPTPSALER